MHIREKKYIRSVFVSVFSQIISVGCGIVLPAVMLKTYGSEIYGATTSITQFLGYIALLEGGIGGVARAALYKPLADHDTLQISRVISYIQKFFKIIAAVFVGYTLVIACFYNYIAKDSSFEWLFSFALVVVISLSSLAQYYFGIAYNILLQADQRMYITVGLNMGTTLINTIISCTLAYLGFGIIVLKLAWCGVHFLRIAVLNIYVRKKYHLIKCEPDKKAMPQKWDAFGQHIAFFLHGNTDIIVLTILSGLAEVAVYSIYNYITASLHTMVMICAANMEAIYGEMIARNDQSHLNEFMGHMEFLLNSVATVCFSTALYVILPFVSIYTRGVADADYQRPAFALMIIITQLVNCIRMPYLALPGAAGHYRQTAPGAYIEALMNIVLSVALCLKFGLVGVVFATFLSVSFRMVYNIFYIAKNIAMRPKRYAFKRLFVTGMLFTLSVGMNVLFLHNWPIPSSYLQWIIFTVMSVCISALAVFVGSWAFYRDELSAFLQKVKCIFFKLAKHQ